MAHLEQADSYYVREKDHCDFNLVLMEMIKFKF